MGEWLLFAQSIPEWLNWLLIGMGGSTSVGFSRIEPMMVLLAVVVMVGWVAVILSKLPEWLRWLLIGKVVLHRLVSPGGNLCWYWRLWW